jgi:type 1 fimbriae regulatory protein FimB
MNTKRTHFTSAEVERLLAGTKGSRYEVRDRCFILLMFRHGLRVSEAIQLQLTDVDLPGRRLYVARLKHGVSTTHPLRGNELRTLRGWLVQRARLHPKTTALFVSERRQPLSRKTAWALIRRCGSVAGLACPAHPHMLRHACGYALAEQGAETRLLQRYLGHRQILHTLKYTARRPLRFESLWRERS